MRSQLTWTNDPQVAAVWLGWRGPTVFFGREVWWPLDIWHGSDVFSEKVGPLCLVFWGATSHVFGRLLWSGVCWWSLLKKVPKLARDSHENGICRKKNKSQVDTKMSYLTFSRAQHFPDVVSLGPHIFSKSSTQNTPDFPTSEIRARWHGLVGKGGRILIRRRALDQIRGELLLTDPPKSWAQTHAILTWKL